MWFMSNFSGLVAVSVDWGLWWRVEREYIWNLKDGDRCEFSFCDIDALLLEDVQDLNFCHTLFLLLTKHLWSSDLLVIFCYDQQISLKVHFSVCVEIRGHWEDTVWPLYHSPIRLAACYRFTLLTLTHWHPHSHSPSWRILQIQVERM